jgi:hypothetical protein
MKSGERRCNHTTVTREATSGVLIAMHRHTVLTKMATNRQYPTSYIWSFADTNARPYRKRCVLYTFAGFARFNSVLAVKYDISNELWVQHFENTFIHPSNPVRELVHIILLNPPILNIKNKTIHKWKYTW